MRKKAGKSTFLGASARNMKAQLKPDRAAGHPSSAGSPKSRRSGGRGCSAASSDLNQRLCPAADRDPPPTSQALREARPTTYPQRRDRNRASNPHGFNLLEILREAHW